ncbi:hypothetical protein HacjB3_02520 [Halalkalicoccus jeotgali B3]|uniref:Uncharacterized protein n=1 Tax=Halalkalicoccus jeotgali (strain DSM 18796 / CECT 7217 / JCM 14584 / KCTC 4019 / B3) TaxID=795797 RepID=D8J6M0_HALJB|nr:hypothetical protein HacjB3_02520 [Halalkalicoccus jeotgali B3]
MCSIRDLFEGELTIKYFVGFCCDRFLVCSHFDLVFTGRYLLI